MGRRLIRVPDAVLGVGLGLGGGERRVGGGWRKQIQGFDGKLGAYVFLVQRWCGKYRYGFIYASQ